MASIYIITRFNIASHFKEGGELLKGIDPCTDCDYLSERFRLFDKYTWPSVTGQTYQNFRWIVLFSDRTPEMFRDRIDTYRERYQAFIPAFINENEAYDICVCVNSIIQSKKDEKYLVMRLDNDDAIRNDGSSENLGVGIRENIDI